MKILHTSDWHIGNFRSPIKDGVNLRTEDTKRCLDRLVQAAREEHPDYTLISGDIFHVGRLWSDRCCEEIVTAIHYIRELSAVSGQVIVMRGTPNHDGIGQFNVLSEMFAGFRNVYVATTPQVIAFDDVDIAVLPGFDRGTYRAKFPGLSAEEENEVFTQELSNVALGLRAQCSPVKKSILMAHYTVPGCNMESGQTMLLTKFEPVLPPETLRAAGYSLVAMGHIHRPQEVPNVDNCFYAGAINAFNFNDENQERGFWIHTEAEDRWESRFYSTPYRGFISFTLTDTDMTAINLGSIDEVAYNYWRYNGAVKGKIVRIHYTCSAENRKAFNKSLLERALLEDGAFMVWEILPNQITEFANRTELTGATDPETNLVRYLEEKQVEPEKIQELVLKARPIIAEAEAGTKAAANNGVFEPVEITVKNYRNYEEETFNFEDISFCTINGQNGAGKSSLFMDAIIDCLFEEPREGILKDENGKAPWLRNDESARSGSIMFTFRIGEKEWRVTRTRARSGKGTLNIAQFIDNGWQDCSKERANDTQQEILDILGMDSFTFKSCALIMQDQYGLFLQAKPEKRVEVLGTLLGLGEYQDMEQIAAEKAKENKSAAGKLRDTIEIHAGTIASFGRPEEALDALKIELAGCESELQVKTAERDRQKLILANRQEAAKRHAGLLETIATLQGKKAAAEQNSASQQAIINSTEVILGNRPEIEAKVAEYRKLLEQERALAEESALYAAKKQEAENITKQIEAGKESIAAYSTKLEQKENEISSLQSTTQDDIVRKNADDYAKKKAELAVLQEKAVAYEKAKAEYSAAIFRQTEATRKYEAEKREAKERQCVLEKKVAILEESRCMDIENAQCRFLQDAKEAEGQLSGMGAVFADIEARKLEEEERAKAEVDAKQEAMQEIGYDEAVLSLLQSECNKLFPYVGQLEAINRREGRIALLKADIKHLQSNIADAQKRLSEVKLQGTEVIQERDRYAQAFDAHAQVLGMVAVLEPWLEKEKQLPVAQERNITARNRVEELTAELECIASEIAIKQMEANKEQDSMGGIEELEGIVFTLEAEVVALNSLIGRKQMEIGALQQQAGQIVKLQQEIAVLQEKQAGHAKEEADYEVLKIAFSQSGVPHQIIRSIIPKLTATANTILGQMTGGKMGVEFRLEQQLKNGKEKASLDIFIEDYGKPALPYLSKSGGEKVKSSLSVILGLAEIKSSSAGIQLGMLFIDEPPFLDGDGMQAYCDALETIRERYGDIKVMAITHDPAMKARFPQSIDVIRTDGGSKVIYG